MEPHFLSFILVNYRQPDLTIRCITSILTQKQAVRIILVDNSEQPDQLSLLYKGCEELAPCKIIETPISIDLQSYSIIIIPSKNMGFAAANNLGLELFINTESTTYAWILNNDTQLASGAIEKLTVHLENELPLIAGTALLYATAPTIVQACGGTINLSTLATTHIYQGFPILDVPQKVLADHPIGASMLVNKEFIKTYGKMNEQYFLYFEEADWLLDSIKSKRKVPIYTDVHVYHEVGYTIGTNSLRQRKTSKVADYYYFRSMLWFARKVGLQPYLYTLLLIPFFCLKRVFRMQFSSIIIIIKAVFDSFYKPQKK